jgi:hypothetical protein
MLVRAERQASEQLSKSAWHLFVHFVPAMFAVPCPMGWLMTDPVLLSPRRNEKRTGKSCPLGKSLALELQLDAELCAD